MSGVAFLFLTFLPCPRVLLLLLCGLQGDPTRVLAVFCNVEPSHMILALISGRTSDLRAC